MLMEEYGDTMQRALIGGLAAVGRVLGYEAYYPNYSGPDPSHSDDEGRRVTYEAKMVSAAAATILAIFALFFLRRWIDWAGRR